MRAEATCAGQAQDRDSKVHHVLGLHQSQAGKLPAPQMGQGLPSQRRLPPQLFAALELPRSRAGPHTSIIVIFPHIS